VTTAFIPTPLGPTVSIPSRRIMSDAERTDREREHLLVVAAQRGENESFAALVRLHQRRAYAVARSIVITHEDAEDAVQEGFLHAYRALHRFPAGPGLRGVAAPDRGQRGARHHPPPQGARC
jgi:hypothetical protein